LSPATTTEAVEAPVVTVDPGQVIRVNARFPGSPETIRFSFLPPQSADAIHDPGAYDAETQIRRDGDDLYCYSIDTRQMRGGLGWWYFVSEDPDPSKRRAKVGKFIVRDVPPALYSSSVVMLGTEAPPHQEATKLWPWIAGSAATGALGGALLMRRGASHAIEADISDDVTEPVVAAPPPRPRSSDGKFLSAAAISAAETADESNVETEEPDELDSTETASGGTALLVTLGVAAIGALGYWLWRRHSAAKEQAALDGHAAPPTHTTSAVGSGFDLLGID
jgi:hypothetical protein